MSAEAVVFEVRRTLEEFLGDRRITASGRVGDGASDEHLLLAITPRAVSAEAELRQPAEGPQMLRRIWPFSSNRKIACKTPLATW